MDLPCAPATALGPVSVATTAWRARDALYLTAVVKATFELVPEGRMRPTEPDPVATREEPDASGVGLRTAGDLAPYLGQPEVWLTGHAAVPLRFSQPELRVQLALVQQGVVRIDKQVDLRVSGATGEPPRVRIAGMGPIAESWPLRQRWLAGIEPGALRGPVLDIPDALHWEYFQTAPLDQRLHALHGDDWLVLGGMIVGRPRLRTQLPEAWGAARLYRRSEAIPRAGEPVPLHADTLQIDVDRLRCSILFRGRVKLEGDVDPASLHVVAGLAQPGREVVWRDPFATVAEGAPGIPFGGTMGIPDDVARELAKLPSTPFVENRPADITEKTDAGSPFAGTLTIPSDLAEKLAAAVATPFEQSCSGTISLPVEVAQALAGALATPFQTGSTEAESRAERDHEGPIEATSAHASPSSVADATALAPVFSGTITLPGDLAAAAATPFERPALASATMPPSFGATLTLPEELSQQLIAAALAMPFEARPEQPAPEPASPRPEAPNPASAFTGTVTLPDDLSSMLAAAFATPFEAHRQPRATEPALSAVVEIRRDAGAAAAAPAAIAPPVPPLLFGAPRTMMVPGPPDDAGVAAGGLGAEFLAALAEAGVAT